MDEDLAIIEGKARSENIKNFLIKNKRLLILIVTILVIFVISYFGINEYKNEKKIKISDQYNSIVIEYSEKNKEFITDNLIEIVNKKDTTYSPLALYFIIDNALISDQKKINDLFDVVIEETSLDKEIKNLIIYKKALYNADNVDENQLLKILNPIINSNSVWKAHSLYLIAEYFYSKNEKQKSREFFSQIMNLENANQDFKIEAQKRLNRDLSE
jgi:predicted negative regulator of RcsB-dependent stress response